MKTLAVLLGASILLNIVLIVRRPAPPEPAPRRVTAAPRVVERSVPDAAEVVVLRERVRELEAEKAAAAPRAEAVAPPDRLAAFKDKLPRALRLMKDGRALASAGPEGQLELQEVTIEFQRARLDRWKDPHAYVEALGAVLEQMAAETKAPLSPYQKAELRRTLEEYEGALAGMADKDAFERYLREVGPEADILQKLRSFVTPEQEARVSIFGALSPWTASMAPWIDRHQAEGQVVQQWMAAYGLDESKKAAVAAAARLYVSASDALNAQLGRDALPGRETPEWRRRTALNLLDALGSLEASLTPEQRERLRARRPAEVRVFDPAAVQRLGR